MHTAQGWVSTHVTKGVERPRAAGIRAYFALTSPRSITSERAKPHVIKRPRVSLASQHTTTSHSACRRSISQAPTPGARDAPPTPCPVSSVTSGWTIPGRKLIYWGERYPPMCFHGPPKTKPPHHLPHVKPTGSHWRHTSRAPRDLQPYPCQVAAKT